jgi:hypothetical protein
MKNLQDIINELPEERQQKICNRAREIELEVASWDLEAVYEDVRAYVEKGMTSVPDQGTLDMIRHVSDIIQKKSKNDND